MGALLNSETYGNLLEEAKRHLQHAIYRDDVQAAQAWATVVMADCMFQSLQLTERLCNTVGAAPKTIKIPSQEERCIHRGSSEVCFHPCPAGCPYFDDEDK